MRLLHVVLSLAWVIANIVGVGGALKVIALHDVSIPIHQTRMLLVGLRLDPAEADLARLVA